MAKHIIEEAKRCLQCKNPLCVKGCPINTSIPTAIAMLLDGAIKDAGEMLFLNNPLSVVCSFICPHEKFCEGHCILAKKNNPIQWSNIEQFISSYYMEQLCITENTSPKKNHRVAVIGSGPAGITVAFILALAGYKVTIFESQDLIGGVMRYGIPEFRLPKDILEKMTEMLIQLGVKIRPNITFGPILSVDTLFDDGYNAVFIGTGVWSPRPLRVPGESLGHVHYAINYLKNPSAYQLGKRVAVIGAGNVAMDVARTALRKGAKSVSVLYRRGEDEMTATQFEIDYAKIEGVNFEFFKSPTALTDDGIMYNPTEYILKEDGTKELIVHDDIQELFECDTIFIAVSQIPHSNVTANTKDIKVGNTGLIITDIEGRTSRTGVFASGDAVTGAKTVVEAAEFAKKSAEAIMQYLDKL